MNSDHDFRKLYEDLYPAVWAHCHRLLGSAGDADDATQEVFLAVYQGLGGFRGECKVFTWVYRIATRVALRHRARVRRGRETQEVAVGASPPPPDVLQQEVRRALASLSLEHATILSLFAVEGLSHREIAEILGVPEGTVWSRLHTARGKLAEALDWI